MHINDSYQVESTDHPVFDFQGRRFRRDYYVVRPGYGYTNEPAFRVSEGGPILNKDGSEHAGGHTGGREVELSDVPEYVLFQAAQQAQDHAERVYKQMADFAEAIRNQIKVSA